MSRKDLRPSDIMAIVDAREQLPLDLHLPFKRGTLAAADYSVEGLESMIAVERKGPQDLIACVGRERDRFEACLKRMQGYEVRAVVLEMTWADIEFGGWRGKVTPAQVKAALYSWSKHVSIFPAGSRKAAASIVSGILFSAARTRWRELQSFYGSLKVTSEDKHGQREPGSSIGTSGSGPGDQEDIG
jgi:DNA excision repair protein ERCC-4